MQKKPPQTPGTDAILTNDDASAQTGSINVTFTDSLEGDSRDGAASTSATVSDAVPQPHDPYRLAFFILYLQGIGSIFPWNVFITKTDYYALAFRGSEYAPSFWRIVTTTYTLMGLVTIFCMQRVQHLSSPRSRVVGGLTLMLGVFLVIFGFSAAPLALPTEQLAPFLQRTRTSLFSVTVAGVALAQALRRR